MFRGIQIFYCILGIISLAEVLSLNNRYDRKGTTIMEEFKEEFKLRSEEVIEKIRELIREGNVSRIIVKDEDGKTYLEIPVTFGVIGALLAPWLAAIGAIAAMVGHLKIEVIRSEEPKKPEDSKTGSAS